MIEKIVFDKKKNLQALLSRRKDVYAVDSRYINMAYLYDGKKFGVVDEYSARLCKFEEVPEFAEHFKVPAIRKELLEIYEDIKERRKDMDYEF